MKHLLTFLALVVVCCGLPATLHASVERAEVLRAINWVENPTNHARRGAHGELGPYQFRAKTWQLHTRKSFNLAVIREHADEIAVKHYEWIKRGLERAGIDPNPFNIAMAWNSGLGSVTNGKVPMVTYNYAERVSNLVESQRAQRLAANRTDASSSKSLAVLSLHLEGASEPVQFTLAAKNPVFVLQAEPLYEPVVTTDKSVPVRVVAQVEASGKPVFSLSGVAASGIAFVLP